jgi:hypothetical protein
LRQLVEEHSKVNDRVLVIASSIDSSYPLMLQSRRRPGSRYPYEFPIAFVYSGVKPKPNKSLYRRLDEAPLEELQFLRDLSADVSQRKPRLIVVQNTFGGTGLPDGFNLFDYLNHVGWNEKNLDAYRRVAISDDWIAFERQE